MTATTTTTPVDAVLSRLEGVRHTGQDQWEARCPAHEDRSPSLSVSVGEGGRALLCCQAGCELDQVVAAIGMTTAELFPPRPERERSRISATYPYVDETGELLFEVVRFDPKDFRQRRPKAAGGWEWRLNGVRRVLYRLPEVLAGVEAERTIWITEGEKDADALARAGEVATCNPQGAGKWSKVTDAPEILTGADVVIWVDDDPTGHAHGREIARSIDTTASRWVAVRSTSAKDAAEHLGAGRSLDELERLAKSDGDRSWLDEDAEPADDPVDELDEEPPPPALVIESIAAVAARVDAAPPPKFLARPVWVEDAYGVIGAEDKAGKSWAALDLAVAVAAGTKWLDQYQCETPGPVLMFLGEGSDRKTIRRLRAVCEFHDTTLENLELRVCHRAPNLTRAEHIEAIDHEIRTNTPRLVILDPLYLSLGSTNSGILSEMGNVLGPIQHTCQRASAALVIVHHWNKTGTGNDRKRFTGSGTAEWGRVLASISINDRGATNDGTSTVDQTFRFIGDEIADTSLQVTRRVWTDDPDDLTSAMHYAVVRPKDSYQIAKDDTNADTEIIAAVLEVLADGAERNQKTILESVKGHRAADVRRVLLTMADDGPLKLRLGARNAQLYRLTDGTRSEP